MSIRMIASANSERVSISCRPIKKREYRLVELMMELEKNVFDFSNTGPCEMADSDAR